MPTVDSKDETIRKKDEVIANLKNCISANYASAMELKKRIGAFELIFSDDFDLNMIIDRSYLHLKKGI